MTTKKSPSDNIELDDWFRHFQEVFNQGNSLESNESNIYNDSDDANDHYLNK